jgi:hypothetical protein
MPVCTKIGPRCWTSTAPGAWIAACTLDAFVEALCERGPLPRDILLERAAAFRGATERAPELQGRYACYSHAWSPYFSGQLIRGELTLGAAGDTRRLVARYTEHLPTKAVRWEGALTRTERAIYLDLRARDGAHALFCLFLATSPWSVLGGLMCGATVIGPEAQPSVTRILMVRLPAAIAAVPATDPYLPVGAAVVADLEKLGMPLNDRDRIEPAIQSFLGGSDTGGLDQIGAESYRVLVDLFDRQWLTHRDEAATMAMPV